MCHSGLSTRLSLVLGTLSSYASLQSLTFTEREASLVKPFLMPSSPAFSLQSHSVLDTTGGPCQLLSLLFAAVSKLACLCDSSVTLMS